MKRIQYDILVSGISNAQAQERVSVDKFPPQITPPQSNWQKLAQYSVAAIAPFLFFVAPVNPVAVPQHNTSVMAYPRTTQYQAMTKPVTVPAAPQTITVDKWYRPIEQPRFDVKRYQYLYPSFITGLKLPAMASQQDNFEFGGLDTGKWSTWGTVTTSATTNLDLEITSVASGSDYGGVLSLNQFDLTGSYAFSQLLDAGSQVTGLEVYPIELSSRSNALSVMVAGNTVFARHKINGSYSTVGSSIAYNATTMKWFRVRESGGTIFYEYATDPTSTWTVIASETTPFDITAMTAGVTLGTWQQIAQTTAKYDNFNVLPSQYQFSWQNYTWNKRIHAGDPSTNQYWSPDNISGPDGNDYLTFQLVNLGESPIGSEIFSTRRGFGYGTYVAIVNTELDTLDHRIGWGGLFTFDFTAPPDYREIDAHETRDYASSANIQILHSHAWNNSGVRSFTTSNQDVNAAVTQTHRMIWEPGKITFDAFIGLGFDGINYFHTVQTDNIPTPNLERVHFNIWNNTGVNNYTFVPSFSVVVQGFSFMPLGAASYLTQSVPHIIPDVKRQQYLYPTLAFDFLAIPTQEPESSFGYHPDKIFDVARTQYVYPWLAIDPKQLTQPERSTPDKWLPQKPDIVRDVLRQQYTYPNFFFDPQPFPSPIFAGSWHPAIEQPVGRMNPVDHREYLRNALADDDDKNYLNPERTTPDKWIGSKPDIVFDIKRQQYTYPHLTIDTSQLTQPERITPDKWVGQKPDKIFDASRNQYLYPSSFFVQITSENITVDKWFKPTEQPRQDVVRNQHLYPSFFFNPLPIPPPTPFAVSIISDVVVFQPTTQYQMWAKPTFIFEIITPDKWTPQKPDITSDVKRTQYTYPSFFIDPNQLTKPERTTPDKWTPQKPDFIFDLKRQQYTYPCEFRTEVLTPVSEPINADSYHPDKLFDVVRQQHLYPSYFAEFTQINTPTLDKWSGAKPDMVSDLKRTQYLYPSVSFVQIPSENITVNKWFKEAERPRFDLARNQYVYPSFSIDSKQLTQPERSTIDKWIGNKPDIIFDTKRTQYTYPNFFFDPQPFPSPVFADKWHPETQRPPKDVTRNQYLYPSFSTDAKALTQPERVSSDKWTGQYPNIIFDQKRQQYTYPSEFRTETLTPVSEPINADSYHPDIIFDLKRQQYLYPNFFMYTLPQPDTHEIYIDAYDYVEATPVWDVARNQYLYPSFFTDARSLTQPERTTPDKWLGNRPDIIFDTKRTQYLYPSYVAGLSQVAETVFVDKWLGNKPDIIFDVKRQQYVYPSVFFGRPLEFISPDKWSGSKPDILFDIKRTQFLYPSFTIDPRALAKIEPVTFDRWNFLQSVPRWDIPRLQYLYPFYTHSPLDFVPFGPLPPATGGVTVATTHPPTGGSATSKLAMATGGASQSTLSAATGGATSSKLSSPTGGNATSNLGAPTNPKSIY